MHDITDLERRGLPGVYVATEQFVSGAEAQSKALGSAPEVVFVEHPIQDRTDDEMIGIATRTVEKLIDALTA